MFKLTKLIVRLISIAMTLTLSVPALANPQENPVFKALMKADEDALHIELERAGTNAVLRELLTNLIRGDSDGTFKAVETCVTRAMAAGAVDFAIFCNRIAAKQYWDRGNIPKWAQLMSWVRTLPVTPGQSFGDGYEAQDYRLLESLPSPSWSSSTRDPAGVVVNSVDGQPIAEIEVGGRKIRAIVDTGYDAAVIIKKEVADQLGMTPVVKDIYLLLQQGGGPGNTDQVFLTNVRIQDEYVSNIAVVSTGKLDHFDFDGVVGLPFLEQIAKITFVGAKPLAPPAECSPKRMLRSTELAGRQRLMIPVALKNGANFAFLDTGMDTAFAIQSPLPRGKMPEARIVLTQFGETPTYANNVEEELTVLGVHLGPRVGKHQYSPDLAYPTIVGMGAFHGRSLTLDFSKGMACVW